MYQPSLDLLEKYADIIVNFALWGGKGVQRGDVVFVQIPECAKPMYVPLQQAILKSGAIPIFEYTADGVAKSYFETATMDQITFYPNAYHNGRIEQMTHVLSVIAKADKYELQGVDSHKIVARTASRKEYINKVTQKELEGKMSWTLFLYGTQSMADDIGMSLEEYWEQIIRSCYLDDKNPIARWKQTNADIERIIARLNEMKIQYVHVVGDDADLKIKLGSDRKWLGGRGCNIPSFEIFTSPDCRDIEGWIRFNQPLFRYGQKIDGISLCFEKGKILEFDAKDGKPLLTEIFKIPGTRSLGEFSLTDVRHSSITKFMGETLFDENFGGQYGNTHVAIGRSFDEAYIMDSSVLSEDQKKDIGFNQSVEHIDIISTTNRVVTATLEDGSKTIIYKDGKFVI